MQADGVNVQLLCYITRVRQVFIAFLIAFLPLQTSWAAVAVHGNHSHGKIQDHKYSSTQLIQDYTSSHTAHHEHDHKHAHTTLDGKNSESSLSSDSDCCVCHVACCNLMLTLHNPTIAIDFNTTHSSWLILLSLKDSVAEIERPVWQPTL